MSREIAEIRRRFPGAERLIYLNVSGTGLLSVPVREAIDRYLDAKMAGTLSKDDMRATVERARMRFAKIVGGEPDEVAITKNVSEGLNLFASSLPWRTGDNVVLCQAIEHPNNIYLWYNLRRMHGIELRTVEPRDGAVPVDRMANAIDRRTRVVTVPHISFSPGFVTDVKAISRAAHAHHALVLVDAAQSVGAVGVDVHGLGADALVAATQKSLLALYGFGFLWIRRALAETLQPAHAARYGIDPREDVHVTALGKDGALSWQPAARRFDLGNFNYLGAVAADAALGLIEEIGVAAIESHNHALATHLAHGLLSQGWSVAGGAPGPHLAHIVAVGSASASGHASTTDPSLNALYEHLTANGVRLAIRRGVLRFSTAVYNSVRDIDRVIQLAKTGAPSA